MNVQDTLASPLSVLATSFASLSLTSPSSHPASLSSCPSTAVSDVTPGITITMTPPQHARKRMVYGESAGTRHLGQHDNLFLGEVPRQESNAVSIQQSPLESPSATTRLLSDSVAPTMMLACADPTTEVKPPSLLQSLWSRLTRRAASSKRATSCLSVAKEQPCQRSISLSESRQHMPASSAGPASYHGTLQYQTQSRSARSVHDAKTSDPRAADDCMEQRRSQSFTKQRPGGDARVSAPHRGDIVSRPSARVVFVGPMACGKTVLAQRITDPDRPVARAHAMTVGVDCFNHVQAVAGDAPMKMIIWDLTGSPAYRSLTRMYYLNTHVVCLVYDCTDASRTLSELLHVWLPQEIEPLMKRTNKAFACMLVGCKIDLALARAGSTDTYSSMGGATTKVVGDSSGPRTSRRGSVGQRAWSAPPEAAQVQALAAAISGRSCPHVHVSVHDLGSVTAFAEALWSTCLDVQLAHENITCASNGVEMTCATRQHDRVEAWSLARYQQAFAQTTGNCIGNGGINHAPSGAVHGPGIRLLGAAGGAHASAGTSIHCTQPTSSLRKNTACWRFRVWCRNCCTLVRRAACCCRLTHR